jgi:ABC-2 type transport system ATP-binding protein
VVILDEPTTGLDPNQLIEIRNLIQEIGKQKTVMLSTHIMQEVEACCERALIISKGKLVADKKIENLSSDLSAKVIEVEFASDISLDILNQHKGIKEVIALGDNRFSISSSDDIRKAIFQMAVKNNWELLEMKSKTQNLEDLFHQLTVNNDQ